MIRIRSAPQVDANIEREYSNRLRQQLAAMRAARDELADIANDLNGDNGDDEELHRRRAQIAALRNVGGE